MAVTLRNLAPNTRVNFVLSTQVNNRLRFNNFAFQGEVGYAVAGVHGDIIALVNASKAYFREGSQKDADKITYVLVKQSDSSPMVVIPEPLIQLNSVEVSGNTVHTVIIRDSISSQALQELLTGNNLQDFSISSSQV